MQFTAQVEQWRDKVAKYFRPEDVDLALWVIQHESGGNPTIPGDAGASIGLFQMNTAGGLGTGSTKAQLADPDYNIRLAAQAVYGGSGWAPWGANSVQYDHPYDPATGTGYFGAIGYAAKEGRLPPEIAQRLNLPAGSGAMSAGNVHDPTMQGGSAGSDTFGVDQTFFDDPRLEAEYQKLRQAQIVAYQAWSKANFPESGPLADAYYDAMTNKLTFEEEFASEMKPRSSRGSDTDPAQTAFENSLLLGDYEMRQAEQAFRQWYDKNDMAQEAAAQERNQRQAYNEYLVGLEQARRESPTPGMLPRATSMGYIETSYGDLLKKWQKAYGAEGGPPGVKPSGITPPGTGTGTGQSPADAAIDDGHPFQGPGGAIGAQVDGHPFQGPGSATNAAIGPTVPFAPGVVEGVKEGAAAVDTAANKTEYQKPWNDPFTPSPAEYGTPTKGTGPKRSIGGGTNVVRDARDVFGQLLNTMPQTKRSERKGTGPARRWWQRGYAEGGMNIPGGPAWVGEREPELMEVPGFGAKIVGAGGPEEVMVPEGANIYPMAEMVNFMKIKQAAKMGTPIRKGGADNSEQAQQQRANDPQLQEKVKASIQKAMAAHYAANPPYTPVMPPGVKDYFAWARPLTGVPATEQEAMMQQEQAIAQQKQQKAAANAGVQTPMPSQSRGMMQ